MGLLGYNETIADIISSLLIYSDQQNEQSRQDFADMVANTAVGQKMPMARDMSLLAYDAALNFNPSAVGMMVGPKAVGFDKMRQFSNMADRMPRAEISDDLMKWKIPPKQMDENAGYMLGDVIDHNKLFDAYPELKNKIIVERVKGNGGSAAHRMDGKYHIEIGTDTSTADIRNTVIHEVQHIIQVIENWAKGGSAYNPYQGNERTKLLKEVIEDFRSQPSANGQTDMEILNSAKKYVDSFAGRSENAKRLAGEIESRDSGDRMRLTDEQRASMMPYASQNIPLIDWIIRK